MVSSSSKVQQAGRQKRWECLWWEDLWSPGTQNGMLRANQKSWVSVFVSVLCFTHVSPPWMLLTNHKVSVILMTVAYRWIQAQRPRQGKERPNHTLPASFGSTCPPLASLLESWMCLLLLLASILTLKQWFLKLNLLLTIKVGKK